MIFFQVTFVKHLGLIGKNYKVLGPVGPSSKKTRSRKDWAQIAQKQGLGKTER